jgi:hypothetical protein
MSLLTREWKWWPLLQFNLLYVHLIYWILFLLNLLFCILVGFLSFLKLVYYSFSLLYLSLSSSLIGNIFSNFFWIFRQNKLLWISLNLCLYQIWGWKIVLCKIWYYTFSSLNKTNILYHLYFVLYFASISWYHFNKKKLGL